MNSAGVLPVAVGGTVVPLPTAQTLSTGFTINGTFDTITVANAGVYYLAYTVNTTAALALTTRILINGVPELSTIVAPLLSLSIFHHYGILPLNAGDTISLEIFGLTGIVTLLTGHGASITVFQLD
nr:hypothetical protein [Bacillus sp. AFS002410]